MTRSVVLLVNPKAGGGKAKARAATLAPLIDAAGAQVQVFVPDSPKHTAELAAQAVADGVDVLVPVGGDGTIALTLPALRGSSTALGIVPTGTGDDNARTFGHNIKDPKAAAQHLATAGTTQADLGIAVFDGIEKPFLSVLCAGFDSAVNERANTLTWPTGQAKYIRAVFQTLRSFEPLTYRISFDDGEPQERVGMLAAIGNGPSYGGGMYVCKGAEAADGQLDITFLDSMKSSEFLRTFPKVYTGGHVGHPKVHMERASKVSIEADGVVAYADGDRYGNLPVTIYADPGSLRVLVPYAA